MRLWRCPFWRNYGIVSRPEKALLGRERLKENGYTDRPLHSRPCRKEDRFPLCP